MSSEPSPAMTTPAKEPKVHPFFARRKPKTVGEANDTGYAAETMVKWHQHGTSLLVGKYGSPNGSPKVAAFDLDGTLINTKSMNVMPKDEHDWKFWDPSVPDRLHELHEQG
ncbi:DNA kinase/phosphatase Pnk1 [Spiromyces aspiralis]|uniref:DNA kinase/phosphatase Pnk1 n=1 Tax=Spiromyces aspiralis TaxID=68401 RepID=A0ACC1HMW9_9FUNG|nr:DNA kinase/phosphatase Pnk1 [Spiromyces aspiralis]